MLQDFDFRNLGGSRGSLVLTFMSLYNTETMFGGVEKSCDLKGVTMEGGLFLP